MKMTMRGWRFPLGEHNCSCERLANVLARSPRTLGIRLGFGGGFEGEQSTRPLNGCEVRDFMITIICIRRRIRKERGDVEVHEEHGRLFSELQLRRFRLPRHARGSYILIAAIALLPGRVQMLEWYWRGSMFAAAACWGTPSAYDVRARLHRRSQ